MYKPFLLLLSIFLFQVHCTAQPGKEGKGPQSPKGYEIGDKATDFQMKHVDGTSHSLSSEDNVNGYIVIFTSNTCPFAVAYEDRIIELHNKMAPKGYPVIAINSNDAEIEEGDSYDEMVVRHKEKGFPFLYLKDDKEAVFSKYGATKTPHVYLLDKDLIVRYIGAIDDNAKDPENVTEKYVENAIASLEKGETPSPEMTKAIGCPIKSKVGGNGRGDRPKGPPNPKNIMADMDANNDNEISKSEAKGPLARDFDRLDANEDGKLTLEELSKMPKRRKPKH